MSYVIPGPPTAFNGTNEELGGDSSMFFHRRQREYSSSQPNTNTILLSSYREPQPMVPIWRPGLHHPLRLSRPSHGPWHRLPVLWSCPKKISPLHALGCYDVLLRHCLPVVLLGLLSRLLYNFQQPLHR